MNSSYGEEIYPMPAFPTLSVSDLTASTQWYQDMLGFRLVFSMPGPAGQPVLTHLRWAKYADLLLVPDIKQEPLPGPKGTGITLTFAMTGENVDQMAARAKSLGATIAAGPLTQPWNTREVTILDPDGYRLIFTQQADENMTMEQIIENATQQTSGHVKAD
ncbi:MAG: VOC family protein [Planctomycetota bacterium]